MLKTYYKEIIVIVLSIIMVSLICYIVIKPDNNINKILINTSQHKIDSLKLEIINSNNIIDSLQSNIILIDKENITLKNKIIYIKQQANEKINNVDKLTNIELNKFFTERYKY